jgi:hypothetical protein
MAMTGRPGAVGSPRATPGPSSGTLEQALQLSITFNAPEERRAFLEQAKLAAAHNEALIAQARDGIAEFNRVRKEVEEREARLAASESDHEAAKRRYNAEHAERERSHRERSERYAENVAALAKDKADLDRRSAEWEKSAVAARADLAQGIAEVASIKARLDAERAALDERAKRQASTAAQFKALAELL